MKILMTTDTVGGVWNYSLTLCDALMRHGVEVTLATMGAALTRDQRDEISAVGVDYFESQFKLEWMDQPWEDLHRAGQWLLDLHRLVRPDLIHLNSYVHAALPWAAPTVVVGHSCVLSWWRGVKRAQPGASWNRYCHEVRWGLRSADLVVTPTEAMLTALRDCYGWIPHTHVIPNGRDPSVFTPGKKEHIVLTAGRMWDEAKNLRAVQRVAPALPWPVYVAGDTATNGASGTGPGIAEASGTNLQFLGRLSTRQLAKWMARTAIYVHPARYEPFGLSILEAAMSGCALVLGDIPPLREIWQDDAIYVEPDDIDALKRVVQELIVDDERRPILAQRARERAMQFTAQEMARRYLDAYHRLIYRHRASFVTTDRNDRRLSRRSAMSKL